MKVTFDTREKRSGIFKDMRKYPKKYPFAVEQLEIGDVNIGNIAALEIKRVSYTSNDLKASVFDRRSVKQSKQRRDRFFLNIVIIEITNRQNMIDHKFTKQHWESTEFHLEIDFGSIIYHTYSQKETIKLIYKIRDRIMKFPNGREPEVGMVRKIPLTLHQKQIRFLSGLLDVGDKMAIKLLDLYKNPANVINAIGSGKVKEIYGIADKFILKNRELIFGE